MQLLQQTMGPRPAPGPPHHAPQVPPQTPGPCSRYSRCCRSPAATHYRGRQQHR